MSLTKDKRDRLFKNGKPLVRPFDPANDMWVLWAAYDLDSFPNLPKKMSKAEFSDFVLAECKRHSSVLVIEDTCKWFKDGRGPCYLVVVNNFGWRVEVHADYFRWATPRMRLRCVVGFLQKIRNSGEVGVCIVRALEKHKEFFDHLRTYGVLFPSGKIPRGDPRGDEYVYYIGGRRVGINGAGRGVGVHGGDNGRRGESPGHQRADQLSREDLLREQGRLDSDRPAEADSRIDQGQDLRAREPEAAGAAA